jgi:DNA polymerase-3 subunit delta
LAETYENIIDNLKKKIYRPVYFLCGEEPFYIDKISDFAEAKILDESERDFNFHVFYGLDTDVQTVISTCKAFPMMGEFQLVIVKEAQSLKKIEELLPYVQNPQTSTILFLCHKYKKPDERKEFGKAIKKNSVYFVSDKVKDYKLGEWIEGFVKTHKLKIGTKSAALLAEFLGNDLSKINNEIEKLKILLPEGAEITPEVIQKNIGISKDYNVFELQNALGEKNIVKANTIVDYFGKNEKTHNVLAVLPALYTFFTRIIKIHGLPSKNDKAAGEALGMHPFIAKDFLRYAQNYPMPKLVKIFQHLEQADLRAKGLDTTGISGGEILKELMFKILH